VTTFQVLRVGATLRDETGWYAVHAPAMSAVTFEYTHGMGPERYAYNDACIARARREKRTLLTEHGGLWDFWVPIAAGTGPEAVLVTGPFATRAPTSGDVLSRWRWLTGRQGHPADPEFSNFLLVTLATLRLDADLLPSYQSWLECYTRLIAGSGDAHALAAKASTLRATLETARSADERWEAARSMVDERTERMWLSSHATSDFHRLGIDRLPEHALVALSVGPRDELDSVGEVLRRDAFQRACVNVSRDKRMMCGRIGEHGVFFLFNAAGSRSRRRAAFDNLAREISNVARAHFQLRLHFGTSALVDASSLGVRYDQALRAAEQALSRDLRLVHASPSSSLGRSPLRELRLQLAAARTEPPGTLPSRFEQYLQAAAVHSGYRLEALRTHLEVGFDHAAESLVANGSVSEKAYYDAAQALELAARKAASAADLFADYRRAIADLVELSAHPTRASQDRNLRRALAFVHQHLGEPLTLPQIARVAGYAPGHFSQLFQRREGMPLDRYVRKLRIERAKQLLKGTDLSAERIGYLCGFAYCPYFYRVFRKEIHMTPLDYRRGRRTFGRNRARPRQNVSLR
jgi:AraC-like DNA-binding protein